MTRSRRLGAAWAAILILAVAGALAPPAGAGVTPSGSYATDIPIIVPAFRGLEPRLQLSYDSRGANGPLGVGWRLTGVPQIERSSPGRGAPRYDGSDVYRLDGAELVPCTPSSDSPSCRYPPTAAGGAKLASFATRSETYQRIAFETGRGGGRWFVWRKDGTKSTYTAGNVTPRGAYRWTLSRVESPVGNAVEYRYSEAAGHGPFARERQLDAIAYGKTKVRLYYERRRELLSYAAGTGLIAQDRRLKTIDVTVDGKRARAYGLRYRVRRPAPARSLLSEVQLYGTDAGLDSRGTVSGPAHVPPIRLDYPEPPAGEPWDGSEAPPTGGEPGAGLRPAGLYPDTDVGDVQVGATFGPVATGDVDADGRTDWLSAGFVEHEPGIVVSTALARPGGPAVVRSTLDFEPDSGLESPDLIPARVYSSTLDLNGDGRSDLLLGVGYPYVKGFGPDGARLVFEKLALIPALSRGDGSYDVKPALRTPIDQEVDGLRHCRSGDLNGDGRADLACSYFEGTRSRLLTALSDGEGGLALSDAAPPFPEFGGRRSMAVADQNRDGRADVMFLDFRPEDLAESKPLRYDLVTGLSRDGSAASFNYTPRTETDWTYVSNPRGAPELTAADINGDGRPDYLAFAHGPGGADPISILTARTRRDGSLALNEQPVPAALSGTENMITVGDSDGDRREDLLVAARRDPGTGTGCVDSQDYPDATLTRVRSRGDGTFALPATWGDCSASTQVKLRWNLALRSQELSASDTNGDGLADFLVAFNAAEGDSAVLHDDVAPSTGLDTQRWLPAELTGDGRRDWVYVAADGAHTRLHTLVQQPEGTFEQHVQHVPPGVFGEGRSVMRDWKLMDVDDDGRTDLVYVHCSGSWRCVTEVEAFVARGDGGWDRRRPQRFRLPDALPDTPQMIPLDADCDGRSDLVSIMNDVRPGPPAGGVRVQALLARGSAGDDFDTPVFTKGPVSGPFTGLGGDSLGWRPVDVDGDCRTDLVHLAAKADGLEITTLFARGKGDWAPSPSDTVTVPTADTVNWRSVDVNGDRKSDLVHLAHTATGLKLHTLLSTGSGAWIERPPQELGFDADVSDTVNWLEGDTNGDGHGDLVHARRTDSGVRIDTLLPVRSGAWASRSATIPDPGAAGDRDSPTWRLTEMDADGQTDLARVDLAPPADDGGPRRLAVSSLRSTGALDLLTRVRGTAGGLTRVTYAPAAGQGVSDPAHGCSLPARATLQVVTAIATDDGRTSGDTTRYGWACPHWSHRHRGFLGWTESLARTPAAANRPPLRIQSRYLQTDQCETQLQATHHYDDAGTLVAGGESLGYEPPGPAAPYDCLLRARTRHEYGFTAARQEVTTEYAYNEFGNIRDVFEHGAANATGDERTTGYSYAPAVDPWIVGLPAQQFLVEGIRDPAGKLLRSTFYCYDGDNGTDTTSCPGRPTAGQLTAEQRVDDRGLFVTTTSHYDAFGNRDRITSPRGFGTVVTFDPKHHLYPATITDAVAATSMEWDPLFAQLKTVQDANGAATSYEYDAVGRPTLIASGTHKLRLRYLDWGDPQRQRIREELADGTPDGLWSETYLDGLGRVYRVTREGPTPRVRFEQQINYSDASTRPYRQSQWFRRSRPSERVFETFAYDEAGRLVRQTHPDGAFRRHRYDTDGTHTSVTVTNERGHDRTIVSDAYGRVTEVRERERATGQFPKLAYTYNAAGDLLTLTDPNGNVTTNTWDLLGRLRHVDDPDLGPRTYAYDLDGNLRTRVDARNRTLSFTYDGRNRLKSKTYPGGRTITWNYDEPGHGAGVGRLTSISDPSATGCPQGRSDELSYDRFGKVTSQTKCVDGRSFTIGFDYDELGRQSGVTYPDQEQVTYTYDPAGRLETMPGYVTRFRHDAAGHLRGVAYANGTEASFAHDRERGWLDRAALSRGGSTLYDATYTHEPNGLVASIASTTNQMNLAFTHDDLDRLTHVSGDLDETFRYDAGGNMQLNTSVTPFGNYGYPAQGPTGCAGAAGARRACAQPRAPSSIGLLSLRYDANGNLSSVTDPATDKSKAIDWTDDHQPEFVADENGVVTHYGYDASGERVSRRRGLELDRYYGRYVEHSSSRGLIKSYYAGSLLIARNDGSTHFQHVDDLGSVRLVTDAQGVVERRQDYAPFGAPTSGSGTGGSDVQFTGQRHDADNGLIYLHARFYDPRVGQFISPDTVVPDPLSTQALNRYAYAYNSPATYADPGGHQPQISGTYHAQPMPDAGISFSLTAAPSPGPLMGQPAPDPGPQPATSRPATFGEFLNSPPAQQAQLLQNAGIPVESVNGVVVPRALTEAELEEINIQLQITAINGVTQALGPVHTWGMRPALGTTPPAQTGTRIAEAQARQVQAAGRAAPAELGPAGAAAESAGVSGAMAKQLTKNACGPACGQQLLKEAGIDVFQSNLVDKWYKGLTPEALAENMNRFLPGWKGGMLLEKATAAQVIGVAKKGSFIARIGGNPGHFVLVDGIENGMVLIRDPAGGVSRMQPLTEFLEILSGLVYRP